MKPAEESYTRMVGSYEVFLQSNTFVGYNSAFSFLQPFLSTRRIDIRFYSRFYSHFCQPGESILAFVAELRSLAKGCEFGASLVRREPEG